MYNFSMIEKILAFLLLFPMSVYVTIQQNIATREKNQTLVASEKKIETHGKWEKAAQLSNLRYEFKAALAGDEIYIVGGLYLPTIYAATGNVEAYNVKTNKWKEVSPLPVIIHHPGVTSDGKYIYVIGGHGFGFTPYNLSYRYDPQKDMWERLPDMPTSRGALGLIELDKKIYAVGGASHDEKFSTLEVYDIETKKWETKKSMPTPREHLAVAEVQGKIYVLGGFTTERFESLKTVEVYDPKTDTWEEGKPLPLPLSGFAAASLNDNIFIFGGQQGVAVSGEVHRYDTKKDTWHRVSDLPFPRYSSAVVTVGDKIHVLGGSEREGIYQFLKDHDVFIP